MKPMNSGCYAPLVSLSIYIVDENNNIIFTFDSQEDCCQYLKVYANKLKKMYRRNTLFTFVIDDVEYENCHVEYADYYNLAA